MKFVKTAQAIIFSGVISASAETNDQKISDAISDSKLNINYNPKSILNPLLDQFIKNCQKTDDGLANISQITSILSGFERRYNQSDIIPSIPSNTDIINKHFYELLDTFCLFKDIIAYDASDDLMFKSIGTNLKARLNSSLLTGVLMEYFTKINVSDDFFASLRAIIIQNFTELAVTNNLILKNIDEIYASLSFVASSWQQFIGKGNTNAQKNIAFLVKVPDASVQSSVVWGSWIKTRIGLKFPTSVETPTDNAILDEDKLTALVKDFDESYLNKFIPRMMNLSLSLYIAITMELKKNNGEFSKLLKEKFHKTLFSILVLEQTSSMIYDLHTLARTRESRIDFHLVYIRLGFLFKNKDHTKIIHEEIDNMCLKNANIQNGDVCSSVLETIAKNGFLLEWDFRAGLNNDKRFGFASIIRIFQRSLFLAIFKLDETIDIKAMFDTDKEFRQGNIHACIYGLLHIFNIIANDKSPIQHINIGLKSFPTNIDLILKMISALRLPKRHAQLYTLGCLVLLLLSDIVLFSYWIKIRKNLPSKDKQIG